MLTLMLKVVDGLIALTLMGLGLVFGVSTIVYITSDFPTPEYCEVMDSLGAKPTKEDVVEAYRYMSTIPITWMDNSELVDSAEAFESVAKSLYNGREAGSHYLRATREEVALSRQICNTLDTDNMNSFSLVVMGRAR